jgi:SAM-dependent methyltransferase
MDLKDYYDSDYHSRRHGTLINDETLFHARAMVEKWLYFRDLPSDARILDLGCGIGQSIALVPGASGWDLSEESLRLCQSRGIRVFEQLEAIPAESFDLVFSRHTLEHVSEPVQYLENARRFACDHGRLRLLLPGTERRTLTTRVDMVNLHLYCWTPQTIVNLLHVSGWAAEQVAYTPYGGYSRLLPLYRALGANAYRIACQTAAKMFGTVELNVTARKR